jgi:hypothetical protein
VSNPGIGRRGPCLVMLIHASPSRDDPRTIS